MSKVNYFNNEKFITGTFDMWSAKKCMKQTGNKYCSGFNWSNAKRVLNHILWDNSANKDLPDRKNVNEQVLTAPVFYFENGKLKIGTDKETKQLLFSIENKYNKFMEQYGCKDSNRNKSAPINFAVAQINLKWPEEKDKILSYYSSLAETLKKAGAEPLLMKLHINEKGQPHCHIIFDNTHQVKEGVYKLGRGKTILADGKIERLGKFEKPLLLNLRKDINLNAKIWAKNNGVKFKPKATTPQRDQKSVNEIKEEYKMKELDNKEIENKSFVETEYIANLVQDLEIEKQELETQKMSLKNKQKEFEELNNVNLNTLKQYIKNANDLEETNKKLSKQLDNLNSLKPEYKNLVNALYNAVNELQKPENKKFDNVPDLNLSQWKKDFQQDRNKAIMFLIEQVQFLTGQKSYIGTKTRDNEPVKPVKSTDLQQEKQRKPVLEQEKHKSR